LEEIFGGDNPKLRDLLLMSLQIWRRNVQGILQEISRYTYDWAQAKQEAWDITPLNLSLDNLVI
jgi:hypothetical protein